jgi:septal ring factor EnvC (AmiA/AmiB activator)
MNSTAPANSSLIQQIRSLATSLQAVQKADSETRHALAELQSELTRIAEHTSMTERLEELAVRFEADHPAVGTALRQAVDALSKAGI